MQPDKDREPLSEGVEEQYRLLMECVTDYAIFLLDPQGRVAVWNKGAERILGYTTEEIVGRDAGCLFTPEDAAAGAPEQELRTAAEAGRADDDRWQLRKDGARFWASGVTTALRDEQGGLRGYAKVLRDQTERKRSEERLREETLISETLRRIGMMAAGELDLHKVVQTVTDETTRLIDAAFGAFFYNVVGASGEAYTLYTLSGAEREAFERFPMPRNTAVFGPTFRGEGVVRLDDVTKDARYGKNIPYRGMPLGHLPVRSYLAVPVLSRSGEVLGGLFFGHPEAGVFSERDERVVVGIAAQAAVAIDNAQLYQRACEQADALRDADRRKDEWMAMLAHELRGPLSPVSNAVQVLMRKGPPEPELRRAREMIARQTGHMARIVEDLLDVTRLARGMIRLRKERLDLSRFVRTAGEDYRPALEQAGLTLHVETPQTPAWVMADATRLTQIVSNLLDNARKFTGPGGGVTVRVRPDADRRGVVLTVRDTGVGIDPGLLPRLFDAFSQADRSLHRTKGGLGLGLSVVKGLVELHRGEIEATSEGPGRGAEFTVRLPMIGEPAALAEAPRPAGRAGPKRRILVVEDHKDSADSLRMLLELLGHEVRVACTGPEGVRAATDWRPDVILSDIGLPGLDGYGVARELRRNPATAKTKLIAITGYGSEDDRRLARQSGFDHVVAKPAQPGVLVDLLSEGE